MKRWAVVFLAVLVLLSGSVVPSHAWGRGGGGWHGGWHGGWGWWGPGALIGGLALGAAVAATYPYPYPYAYPYAYPPPAVVYPEAPAYVQAPAPPIQREVVYPNGKYVLHGDGVTQAWQWVWIPSVPAVPPPQR